MAPTRSNPLALAVLACLHERPMHPYEVAQTLRKRAKHESIRLNYGSLYGMVETLGKRGLVRARETVREGRRPERTIYEITELGSRELIERLSELVSNPVKEYLQFEAALSLLPALSPAEAVSLLKDRVEALTVRLATLGSAHASMSSMGLPRLFYIESEYLEILCKAELEWVRRLVKEIEGGELEGVEMWRGWFGEGPSVEWPPPDSPFFQLHSSPDSGSDSEPTPPQSERKPKSRISGEGEHP